MFFPGGGNKFILIGVDGESFWRREGLMFMKSRGYREEETKGDSKRCWVENRIEMGRQVNLGGPLGRG